MIEQMAGWMRPLLMLPIARRTRRNHGLEHATIHLLSQRVKDLRMAGRSNGDGFILLGEAPTEMIESAARDALRRMRNGEHSLAVHPNCGTNLVTTGMMATLAAMLGMTGATPKKSWERMPFVTLLVMAAILFSQPIGTSLQKYVTTDGDPADLDILTITRDTVRTPFSTAPLTVHRVKTRSA